MKALSRGLAVSGTIVALMYWEVTTKVIVTNHSSAPVDVSVGLKISDPIWTRRILPGERTWLWKTFHETGTLQITCEAQGQASRRDLGYVNTFLSGSASVDVQPEGRMDVERIPSVLSVLSALLPE